MTEQEAMDLVQRTLFVIAPELEGETIEEGVTFSDQFEIDSMDFLNFIIALHEATGVDIPEADYPMLETLEGCVAYLQKKTPA
jgi:acyl carrier protein